MKIVVISPTYNEKENIERLINVLEGEIFPLVKNHEMWLLVADDQSPDGTGKIVQEMKKKWSNLVLLEGNKEGLGAAYVRAMKYAMSEMKADAVIEFDADFQHDPKYIPDLIKAMDEGADYVIGSRYVPGGGIPKEWGLYRKIISSFGSLFARMVLFTFSIHDMTSGFKLSKSSYLERVDLDHLYSKYYAYKIQILYEMVKLGAKVKEVPIIFYERKEGSSKITKKDLVDSFIVVIKLRLRDSQSIIKFLIVGGFGFLLQLILYRFLIVLTHFPLGADSFLSAQLAIFSNYNLNNLWTFKHEKTKSWKSYFVKMIGFYATSNTGVILIQSGLVQLGEVLFGRGFPLPYVYFVIGTGLLMVYNFTVYRFVIWRKKKPLK
jgi:dolichol-phosphate mannosyltransferase